MARGVSPGAEADGGRLQAHTSRAHRYGLLALLTLAAGLRLFHAAVFHLRLEPQHGTNQAADQGIHALMAMHMAGGREWPVFFYGQCYMGSLEPLVSALFYKVLGHSMFAVCLGPVVFSLAALCFIYRWGCDAAGRRAGLVALALCVIGPEPLFWFAVAPRGGYMATLCLCAWLLWLAARLADRLAAGEPVRARAFGLLGVVAGLAWWTNQLSAGALLAAALVLLSGWRGRPPVAAVCAGLAGFAAGSAPWWAWNARHAWLTFSFAGTFEGAALPQGLRYLANYLAQFIDGAPGWEGAAVLRVVVGGCALAAGAVAWRRARGGPRRYACLAALLFVAVHGALFAGSRTSQGWGGARFLIPIVPALAVLLAAGLAAAGRRWHPALAWLGVALLVGGQLGSVRRLFAESGEDRTGWRAVPGLTRFCLSNDVDTVYGHYGMHWVNFAAREAFCYTTGEDDRYVPYARRAALSRRCAYERGYRGIEGFLDATAARWEVGQGGACPVVYRLRHAPANPAPLTSRATVHVTDGDDAAAARMQDEDLNTAWEGEVPATNGRRVVSLSLAGPTRLCGLRLLSLPNAYPLRAGLYAGTEGPETNGLQTLVAAQDTTRFFWSGPQLCYGGLQYVQEWLFEPRLVTRLLLAIEGTEQSARVAISELELLAPAPEPWPSAWSEDQVLALIATTGVRRVYAPRWLAEYGHVRWGAAVTTPLAPFWTPDGAPVDVNLQPGILPLEVTNHLALIVPRAAAPRSWRCLTREGLTPQRTALGPFEVFWFDDRNWQSDFRFCGNLFWSEAGVGAGTEDRHARARALAFLARAGRSGGASVPGDEVAWLRRSVAAYPNCQPAWERLAAVLARSGDRAGSEAARRTLCEQTEPETPCRSVFAGGYELLGCTVPAVPLAAGASASLTCFWRVPPQRATTRYAVFVHFRRESRQFEADHVLLENLPAHTLAERPFPEVFRQTVQVGVPAGAEPGAYTVRLGLVDRVTGERLKVDSPHAARKRSVALPRPVEVVPGG